MIEMMFEHGFIPRALQQQRKLCAAPPGLQFPKRPAGSIRILRRSRAPFRPDRFLRESIDWVWHRILQEFPIRTLQSARQPRLSHAPPETETIAGVLPDIPSVRL